MIATVAMMLEHSCVIRISAAPVLTPLRLRRLRQEEILSGSNTLYFSPDNQRLAFLRFDDSAVPQYNYTFWGTPPRYRRHLGPILLKMAAVSLLAAGTAGRRILSRSTCATCRGSL